MLKIFNYILHGKRNAAVTFIALCLVSINASAQTDILFDAANQKYNIQFSYNNNGSIITPYLGYTNNPFSPDNPGYVTWHEFGDGKFTLRPSFSHYYSSGSNPNPTIFKVTGIYEGGNRPTKPTSVRAPNFMTNTGSAANNYLYEDNFISSGKNVEVIVSFPSVSHGDQMHVAVCYRLPDRQTEKKWKLVFEYNLEGDAFAQTTKDDVINNIFPAGTVATAPYIRTHHGQTVKVSTNKIEFTELNFASPNEMQTVFITLDPNESSLAPAAIKAYLQSDDDEVLMSNTSNLSMANAGPGPHDPNYIKVDRKCITPNTLNQVLSYSLHFQNTGLGPANDSIRIAIALPHNLTMFGVPLMSRITLGDATFAGEAVVAKQPFNSRINNTAMYQPGVLYYDATRSDSLVFNFVKHATNTQTFGSSTISNVLLFGMDTTKPNFMNDKKTMGDIRFKVALPQYNIAWPFGKKNIYAQAAIIFDTEKPVLTEKEYTKIRWRCGRGEESCCCGNKGKKLTLGQWLRQRCE